MKHYPSIIRVDENGIGQEFYTFAKEDGSCIRAEYSRKTGFYKFGSRKQLLDKNDPILGSAIPLFMETLAEPLTRICRDNKWENITTFAEFYGKNSFAGRHNPEDKKYITLFDVAIYKKGMLPSNEFLKYFDKLSIPNFLGVHKWDREFIQKIINSEIDGLSFEGAVGKGGIYAEMLMVKRKTQKWLDAVRRLHTKEEAERIINS